MPFDPTLPLTGSPILSAELRNQFNGLKTLVDDGDATAVQQPDPPAVDLPQRRLLAADGLAVALDWSNGAPKLPDFTTITAPVLGNVAYDYSNEAMMVYAHGEWVQLT